MGVAVRHSTQKASSGTIAKLSRMAGASAQSSPATEKGNRGMADVHRPHIPVAVFMGIIGAIAPLVMRGPPRHLRFCAILSAATHPPATSACHPIPHIWPAPEQHPRPIIRFAAYFSFPITLVGLYAALPDIGPKSHSDRYNLRVRRPGHYHYHARVRYNARAMGLPSSPNIFRKCSGTYSGCGS